MVVMWWIKMGSEDALAAGLEDGLARGGDAVGAAVVVAAGALGLFAQTARAAFGIGRALLGGLHLGGDAAPHGGRGRQLDVVADVEHHRHDDLSGLDEGGFDGEKGSRAKGGHRCDETHDARL